MFAGVVAVVVLIMNVMILCVCGLLPLRLLLSYWGQRVETAAAPAAAAAGNAAIDRFFRFCRYGEARKVAIDMFFRFCRFGTILKKLKGGCLLSSLPKTW